MENPFLSRYSRGTLLVRTNALNLFWILGLMVASGVTVLFLSMTGPGIGGEIVPPVLLAFIVFSLAALLLLTIGQLQTASWMAYGSLLVLMTSVALFSRSGLNEMDLFQTVVVFFLGHMVLSAIGVGGVGSGLWIVVGAAAMVWIVLVPPADVRQGLTIGAWNKEFNPLVISVVYAVGTFAGSLLLVQGRRNLKMMQWDQEIIEASNSMLEATVDERTKALRTILDSSGQGLFTFGADFLVDPDHSAGCFTIFQEEVAGRDADALLFPQGSDRAKEFRQGLGLYFAGKASVSVIFDLLEKETFVKGKALNIEYRELSASKVLVVLTDVTADRQLAERTRADEARRSLVLKALGHKRYFAGLLADAEKLFGVLRIFEERPATAEETQSLLSSIHTFKGNCGFFGFTLTQEVAHDFEYAINDAVVLGQDLEFRDLSLDLKRSYYQELNVIIDALGRGWLEEAGGIVVPREVFDKLAKYIGKRLSDETHLVDVLEHFRKLPLRDLFSRFPFVAQATAEKLGKRIQPMEILGGEIRIVPDRLDGLVSVCVHVINNMIDHGIEPPYVREGQGKNPEGLVKLNIVRESSSVVIEFSDDGQGVSLPAVEARAREKGLIGPQDHPSPREVLQLLFAPGFSTRDEATEISGRGIGLAAVRQETERLGGRIEVQTKLNSGTTFEIILPIGVFANRRAKQPVQGPDRRKA